MRELRNVVRRAVLVSSSKTLRVADLGLGPGEAPCEPVTRPARAVRALREVVEEAVGNAERGAIGAALAATGGRRGDAARLLCIDVKTLYRKMTQYGLAGPE